MQEAEEEACKVVEYEPGLHAVQSVEAKEGLYSPGRQFEHVAETLAPTTVDIVPSGQAWHEAMPTVPIAVE